LNKQRYIELLKNPSSISKEDIPDLEELILQFPYCQNAHILLAKIQMMNGSMHAAKLTRRAALYTSDRLKLKTLISSEQEPVTIKPIVTIVNEEEINTIATSETIAEADPIKELIPTKPFTSDVKIEADKHATNFLEELEKNLKELRESRARAAGILPPYSKEQVENIIHKDNVDVISDQNIIVDENPLMVPEVPIIEEEKKQVEQTANIEIPSINIAEVSSNDNVKKSDVLDLILSFDDRIKDYFDITEYTSKDPIKVSVEEAITDPEIIEEKELELVNPILFTNRDWNLEESRMEETSNAGSESLLLNYLDYIRDQKNKKQKPDKKREKSIISRFIQKNPMISPLSPSQASSEDDDNSNETGIPQAFISETFAVLLEKQGKIEKAIQVYEELILKNPEKNSYFATRIQELKKKNNLQ